MESALPFDYVEFDRSVETTGDVSNMTAEEYLSWVRYQADKLPHVKRVDISSIQLKNTLSRNMPRMEEVSSCPVELLPNDEWQNDILYKFSELRLKLDSRSQDNVTKERKLAVPAMKDEPAWLRFCLESECNSGNNNDDNHNLSLTSFDNQSTSLLIVDVPNENDDGHGLGLNGNDSITVGSIDDNESTKRILKRKRNLASTLGISLTTTGSGIDNDAHSGDGVIAIDDDGDNDDKDIVDEINFSRNIDRENESDDEEDDDNEDTIRAAVDQAETERILSERWNQPINVIPTADVLLQFDQVLTQKLIHYHINWLEEAELTTARATWIYGLLARLEKPLYRETVACIRQLYRRCCCLRSHLAPSLMKDIQVMDHQTNLARLNTIISISGCYFGQGEEYMKSVLAQDELNNGESNRYGEQDGDEDVGHDDDVEEDSNTYMDACSDDIMEDEQDDGFTDANGDVLMTIHCELEDGEEMETKDAINENQSVKKKRLKKDFS